MVRPIQPAEFLTDVVCEVGEGPLWHTTESTLVYLDISRGSVFQYHPVSGSSSRLFQGRTTGGLTIQDDGSLLLFQDGRISMLRMNGEAHEVATGLCPNNERFNDAIADPEGRVYSGAIGGNGRLLRFDPDGLVSELFDGVGIPNGMGFSPDLQKMYFTDSVPRRIYSFDYDRASGDLSNRHVFAEIPPDQGLPDGMTVDSDGFIWTAIWFGGRIKRYSPDGRLDREIFLPAKQTSSVTFGGDGLEEIYVTTASSTGADDLQPPGYDQTAFRGGGLYRLRVEGIKGKPPFRSQLSFPLTA